MSKINLKNIDGIIWDMDGTLIDVRESYQKATKLTAEHFLSRKVLTTEITEIASLIGMNNDWDVVYAIVTCQHDYKKIDRKSKLYENIVKYFQNLYWGSDSACVDKAKLINNEKLFIRKEILKLLKSSYGVMGIATGRPKKEALYALDFHNIRNYFDVVIAQKDAPREKPYPDPIIMAIERLFLHMPIYIGDSISDVEAAKAANIPVIYIGEKDIGDVQFSTTEEACKFLLG